MSVWLCTPFSSLSATVSFTTGIHGETFTERRYRDDSCIPLHYDFRTEYSTGSSTLLPNSTNVTRFRKNSQRRSTDAQKRMRTNFKTKWPPFLSTDSKRLSDSSRLKYFTCSSLQSNEYLSRRPSTGQVLSTAELRNVHYLHVQQKEAPFLIYVSHPPRNQAKKMGGGGDFFDPVRTARLQVILYTALHKSGHFHYYRGRMSLNRWPAVLCQSKIRPPVKNIPIRVIKKSLLDLTNIVCHFPRALPRTYWRPDDWNQLIRQKMRTEKGNR
jgi:hypothetical protein